VTRAQASSLRWLGAGVMLLAVALLWGRFNAPPQRTGAPFPHDFLYYYVPQTERAAERLRQGELPLWDPHTCSGTPLLATLQVGALYPPTWLVAWQSPETALPLRMLLETGLAALLAAALFASWGLAWPATWTGGLLFVFGCVLGNAFWPPALSTLVWLPAVLLCIEQLVQRWRWRWWAALAGCTALQLLAGFPQYAVYTFYLALPYAAVRLWSRSRGAPQTGRSAAARGLGLLVALALGAGLAGAQLLPSLELVGESARGVPLTAERIQHGFFIEPLPLSGVLANALDPRPKLITPGYGYDHGYLGTPTLVLLAIGVVTGLASAAAPRTLLLLGVAVLALLLSDGFHGPTAPLYRLYAWLPTGSVFRDPQRFRVLAFFCLIALAVPGLDAAARGFAAWRGRRARLAIGAAALLATAAILVLGRWPAGALALATLGLVASAALCVRRPLLARLCATAIALLLAADLIHATRPASGSFRSVPTGWLKSLHADAYRLLDAERFARLRDAAGTARLAFPGLEPALGLPPLAGDYRVSCLDPLAPGPWTQLHATLTGERDTRPLLAGIPEAALASLHDVAGVRSIGRLERGAAPQPSRLGRGEAHGLWLLALQEAGPSPFPPPQLALRLETNRDALPRAYLVEHYELLGQEQTLMHVARGSYDFRRSVLLERAPGFEPPGEPALLRPAAILDYAPERVEVEAVAERPALLVLSDTYFPGWRAFVDDVPVEVLRANGLFRAVALDPGRHRVSFRYEPASLRRGGLLSLASLALLIGLPPLFRRLRAASRSARSSA